MASIPELQLTVPVDRAREVVATELQAQGFTVETAASGSLDVSRGSLGTTLVAGAFAGQDMHVKFDVDFTPNGAGSAAQVRGSAMTGFLKGGAIGASRANDVVQETAHRLGVTLAAQGLLVGFPPPAAAEAAVVDADGAAAPTAAPVATGIEPPYTAPAYNSGSSVPPAIDYAGRTNVVAIVAIILGFIFPIGGIVAGAVALAQVKRTGEKGRGLAITGIAVGSALIVLIIIASIAAFAFLGVRAAQIESESPLVPSSEGDGGVTEDTGENPDSESVDVFTLQVGDCLFDAGTTEVTDVEIIDCAQPHDFEVFSEFSIPGDAYPGVDEVDQLAYEGCLAAFPGFVGLSYEESSLDFSYYSPTEESWTSADDRLVSCLMVDTVGPNTGTLQGAAR